jgi:amino acid transporter
MAEPAQGVESAVELAGYEPELKRTLGSFQMFAISFAFISVAVGIFATYDVVLQTGGPVSIWLWVLAAVGQVLVALVYAQFAARIPLSGSSYQWGSRLANPKIGFGLGWLTVCYLAIGVVATDDALAKTAFMPLFNIRPNELTARLITLVVLLIEVVVVVASTRLASMINSSAVALELVIVLGFSIALIIAVAVTGHGSEGNLVSRGVAPRSDYFAIGGGLMDAMILGLATLVGFDSAANLAEEAKDPFRSVPRAIVGSVVAAGVLGLVFLVALTVAIKSIPRVTDSDSPIATIIRDHFGSGTERIFLVAITLAFFGAAIAVMTACSRLVFAMSRDSRFPAHRLMRRVNSRTHTPIPATLLIFVVGVVLMAALPGAALLKLIISGTIIMPIIYGATIVLYLVVRKRLGRKEGAFNLGRFELPVAISALLWVVCALFVITVPKEAFIPDMIVVGLVVAGALYLLGMSMFRREVLETEPGAASVFETEASGAAPAGGQASGPAGREGERLGEAVRRKLTRRPKAPAVLGEGGIEGLPAPAGAE